jgi:hypothetical protein
MVEVEKLERLKRSRSKFTNLEPLNRLLPLIEDRELVDNILCVFANEIETQIFAVAASLCRAVGFPRRHSAATTT